MFKISGIWLQNASQKCHNFNRVKCPTYREIFILKQMLSFNRKLEGIHIQQILIAIPWEVMGKE